MDPAALPLPQRLALAYAPRAVRGDWLALLALDARLAAIVAAAREPVLAQLRLAWWRDQLAKPAADRPRGEPLLALLGGHGAGFAGLVDGWEAMLEDGGAVPQLAQARAAAILAIAPEARADPVGLAALGWTIAELAGTRTEDRPEHQWPPLVLPRALRPLAVLYGLARRTRGSEQLLAGPAALLAAIRLGLTGR